MILTIHDLYASVDAALHFAEARPCAHGSDGEHLVMCLRSARAAIVEAMEVQ